MENRLTAIRGKGTRGLGEKTKAPPPKKSLLYTEKNMVITKGKGGRGGRRRQKW